MSNDLTLSCVLGELQTVFYHQGVYIQDEIKKNCIYCPGIIRKYKDICV